MVRHPYITIENIHISCNFIVLGVVLSNLVLLLISNIHVLQCLFYVWMCRREEERPVGIHMSWTFGLLCLFVVVDFSVEVADARSSSAHAHIILVCEVWHVRY